MVFGNIAGSARQLQLVLRSVIFVPFAYTVFFSMIPTFLIAWDNATRLQERINDNFRGRGNTYDFIVVGAGTAGSVVANRLSEFYDVLLIEEGGVANPMHLIPALTLPLLNRRQTDWSHRSTMQGRACLNSVNQECLISGGRGIGGSSLIGDMAWLRGSPADYDAWARLAGDQSWSYRELLPFFRRTEEFIGSSTDASARGTDGELRIREPDFLGLAREWVRAGEEMGMPNRDLNGQHGQAFSILQYPLRRGMRQTADGAFILPLRLNPRLRILTHGLVTRVLFRDMTNMAYGVEYERFGRTEIAIARREVILSAGALGSPKLLMLSGVGPRDHLTQLGIPVRSDLPVGSNLQDHLVVPVGPFYVNSSQTYLQDRDVSPGSIVNWISRGMGPLGTSGIQAAGLLSSMPARARGEGEWPDLLLLLQGQGVHRSFARELARAKGLMEDEMTRYYVNAIGRDSFHVRVLGARPQARGEVRLRSARARDPLLINPRYLADEGDRDVRIMVEGVEAAMRLVQGTTSFQRLGARLSEVPLPGCEREQLGTPGYWNCYVRRFSVSQGSPVGTAALGQVVDPDLKVRGTRGLRVIDASVIPTIPSGGPLAATFMIGEKGVNMILQEFGANATIPGITGSIGQAIFGRNGVINRNPIQRFLNREFDRMNPLPSLFRRNGTNLDFNPFSRFLGLFQGQTPGQGQGQIGGQRGILNTIVSTLNSQTMSLFRILFGGFGVRNQQNQNPGLGSLFGLGFGQQQRQRSNSSVTATTPASNLFDIIFPQRNNTITLQQGQGQNGNRNFNIFGGLFQPVSVSTTVATTTTRRPLLPTLNFQNLLNAFATTTTPRPVTTPRPATTPNLNPLNFLLNFGNRLGANQNQRGPSLLNNLLGLGPTPSPENRRTSTLTAEGSSPSSQVVLQGRDDEGTTTRQPYFRIVFSTTTTTTTEVPPTPPPTTEVPLQGEVPEPEIQEPSTTTTTSETPSLSGDGNGDAFSLRIPILETATPTPLAETTTAEAPSPEEQTPTATENPPELVTSEPATTTSSPPESDPVSISPQSETEGTPEANDEAQIPVPPEVVNEVDSGIPSPSPSSEPDSLSEQLRAVRLINGKAKEVRNFQDYLGQDGFDFLDQDSKDQWSPNGQSQDYDFYDQENELQSNPILK